MGVAVIGMTWRPGTLSTTLRSLRTPRPEEAGHMSTMVAVGAKRLEASTK